MSACSHRSAWLDGALGPEEAAEYERHLATCVTCQRQVAAWRDFGHALRGAYQDDHAAPTPGLTTRLLARAERPLKARPGRRWVLVAAVVMVVGVGAVFARRSPAGHSAPAPEVFTLAFTRGASAMREGGLETGPEGARLTLGPDVVGLGGSSRVRVARADTASTVLELERGSVAASVDPRRGARSFDVITRLGTVHVTGTVFRVSLTGPSLRVEVQRGRVEVQRQGNSPRPLIAGKALEITEQSADELAASAADFEELAETKALPVVVSESSDAGAPQHVEEDRRPTAISRKQKLEWRARAGRGECPQVLLEVSRVLASHKDGELWLLLGDCQRSASQLDEAVDSYLRAASLKQNRGRLLAASILQDELAQPSRALKVLDAYLADGAETRELEAAARLRRARALQGLGRPSEATATLRGIIARFPDTPAAAEAQRLMGR